MSVEGKDEPGLDGFCGLAVRGEEVVNVGAGHVDQVFVVHVLRVVLYGIKYVHRVLHKINAI